MNTPEARNGIVCDLVRRGLPADYARRAADEFADHHRDLVEELQANGCSESQATDEASRRLGEPRTLVKRTVREYQRRYWCGRWPMLTFLLGPIPLLVIHWLAVWLVLYGVGIVLERCGVVLTHEFDGKISTGERLAEFFGFAVLLFALPALTMYSLSRIAKRAAVDWKWLAASACLLGLAVGMLRGEFPRPSSQARLPNGQRVPADQPLVILGAPVLAPGFREAWNWYTQDLQQIGQLLLPLAVAGIAVLRARRLSLRSERLLLGAC
jgi:hypothetical protein